MASCDRRRKSHRGRNSKRLQARAFRLVWGGALRDEPPIPEEAILGPWVAPYLKLGDRDEALKAFVFGYLGALHSAGRIEWDCAIVPFLPAEKPGP